MSFRSITGAAFLACTLAPSHAAETPSIEELWALVRDQQARIQELERRAQEAERKLADASEQAAATAAQVEATGDFVETLASSARPAADSRIGGYGELHYNNLDAADPDRDEEQIDFHRFVLFFGHEFNDRTRFFSELEIEHSLAGDGAPGEVELEQAYIDHVLSDNLSAQAGLFLLPLGILNETHEPTTFYGVERNDVENVIIPTTWWEAGAGLSGQYANDVSWQAAVHSGLAIPVAGSNAFRVRSGRQKVAEALASDAALTLRLKYTGVPGLELAGSLQYQSDPSQAGGDGLDSGTLFTAHAIYQRGRFGARGLYGRWDFDGDGVEAAGADEQTGWFVEPSYRFPVGNGDLGVYARYEDLDGARGADQFSQWELGLNYWLHPDVVFKFDYRNRDHDRAADAGRDFDGIDLGLGYRF